ncbi:Leucine-rich repeat-containing protein 37A3 [Camelus dromedarius]|uniref:Leucine-rich repeat-containing protein 37A3 n=1 Tax=Camelus dromedarius TaxID=9838 RepID=A0A5N4D1I3_CAMDR|nr:Leucine-rich repeat-containing protein 37A3 [Camelus dromedarius]
MKVLEARKNNTSTELIIESEKASSDKHDVSFSAFVDEQLDFNDETDVISALNYVLPYFSEGNLEDLETAFLPFIKLLFLHLQDGDKPLGYLGKNTRNRFVKPESNNLLYKNKLQTFYHLKKWADSEMQKKIDEVKKKEKTARHVHADPLGHKLWQTFQKELDTAQPQENSPAKTESVGERLQGVDWVLKDPDVIIKESVNELKHWGKQNAQPAAENTAKEEALRRLAPGARGQLHILRRPRKLVGSSFNTKPSFINEDKAAVSSFLPPASTPPKSEVKQESKDLSYTILEDAESIVRNMEASKPTSRPRKKHMFLGPRSRAMHRAFQAERNHHLKREELLRISAGGPPSSAVRSLINPPSREAISSEEQLNSQENPLEEFSPSDPLVGKATLPEEAMSEVAARTDVPSTYSVTAGNFMPTVEHTDETQQEYHNVGTELPSKPTGFTSPGPSSLGDQFEIQVNQQLRSIIPNDYMRSLISHMIRTLKLDCTEMHVKLSCAKFFTRTGLLIKLLSEQQKAKMSKAEGNTDLWKAENYISESTEDRSEQTRMESNEENFFWRMQPLWFRDLYRPLSATRKKKMAQKLHDESSDEEEIFSRVARAPRDGAADVILTIELEEPDEESETAPGSNAV